MFAKLRTMGVKKIIISSLYIIFAFTIKRNPELITSAFSQYSEPLLKPHRIYGYNLLEQYFPYITNIIAEKEIEDRVISIIAHELDIPKDKINLASYLVMDLNADELDFVEIIMLLEDEFTIKINDEVYPWLMFKNVKDFVDRVKLEKSKKH